MQHRRFVRPQWFEIFATANFVVIASLLAHTRAPWVTMKILPSLMFGFVGQMAVGVALRAAFAWREGKVRDYVRIIGGAPWLIDSLRMAFFSALAVHAYGWIKLAVPLLHHRLFDQEISDAGRVLFLGHSPGFFIASLFSAPFVLRAIDWTYANFFVMTLNIAVTYFASSPSRRLRIAFIDANTTMWLAGAWMYVALPTLGPAYAFPQTFLPLAPLLPHTQSLQRLLMANYQAVLGYLHGVASPVNIFFGIAGFPSLHVGFQSLVWLWMRRLWRWGGIVFGFVALTIFIGSICTGWHYFLDGVGGFALAWVCFRIFCRLHRFGRWNALRHAIRHAE